MQDLHKSTSWVILILFISRRNYPFMIDFDQYLQTDLPLFLFLVLSDRMHVINSLPLVWMLDGRIITCEFNNFIADRAVLIL